MKEIIPAIDLKDGKVVRLTKGAFNSETIYKNDPIFYLRQFLGIGFTRVHIINLDGAKTGNFKESANYGKILDIISFAKKNSIRIQLGGGIRTEEMAVHLLNLGVDYLILGTVAIENFSLVKKLKDSFGSRIIIALDLINREIKTQGWLKSTNKKIDDIFLEFVTLGIENFIITDITRDGTLKGANKDLYTYLNKIKPNKTKIIASGGIKSISDIEDTLQEADGVIFGKAYYSNQISNENLKKLMIKNVKSYLTKRIIPCLDVKNGRVVKGINFKNLVDSGDPVELAKHYCDNGADELVFLDITATLEGRKSMLEVISKVSESVFIPLTVGGGIKNIEDMTDIIKAGAEKVAINSAAINDPELITKGAEIFGSQCIVVAIDVKKRSKSWDVYSHAGSKNTGIDAIQWVKKAVSFGAGELLITSMDRDGTRLGYDLELLNIVTNEVSVPIIASGGAGDYIHFKEAINVGSEAVLAASLFHKNEIKINDLKKYLTNEGIQMRLEN